MIRYILLFIVLFVSLAPAQMRHISFQSNISSQQNKKKVENNLDRADGVIEYCADQKSSIITVKFNPEKTDPDKIEKAITNAGIKAVIMKAKHGLIKEDCDEKNNEIKKKDNIKTPESCCGRKKFWNTP